MQELDGGALRVVIERPGTERPKTAEVKSQKLTLEVPIPSWKLGTPRFSTRGTAFIRGSSYAPTEEMRSSVLGSSQRDALGQPGLYPQSLLAAAGRIARRHSIASSQPVPLHLDQNDSPETMPLPHDSMSPVQPRVIEPSMFDDLTFGPGRNDKFLVRYSAQTGHITAATPPRLVAEITSPNFLDYDLLSDFFLTYRSFLCSEDLMAMLIARLRWALARNDETGMIVRVRTFVALRHWILNYFMDDFVIDHDLRASFCDLINAFVTELLLSKSAEPNQIKILGELKKCWRRTCALYWDGPDFAIEAPPELPIVAGGVAGSRDPSLTPQICDRRSESGPPRLDNIFDHDNTITGGYNFFTDVSLSGRPESIKPFVRPESKIRVNSQDQIPISPTSITSDDIISCSFPARFRFARHVDRMLGPHPIPAISNHGNISPAPHSTTVSSKCKPVHVHKRSGSFSDSLRHRGSIVRHSINAPAIKSTEMVMTLPYAGSLVRGNLFPPGQAFVEALAPATPVDTFKSTVYLPKTSSQQKVPSAMSSPGMKKLLGSVRRALGNNWKTSAIAGGNDSPTQGAFPEIQHLGTRSATVNRLPGTAVVPQTQQQSNGARTPMRIDLLGAGIAEDFKKAVREDAEAELAKEAGSAHGSIGVASGNHLLYPSDLPGSTTSDKSFNMRAAMSGITTGSKSIVIFDDTLQAPLMTGALHNNLSTDTITDPYMKTAGGLTPPSTPPEQQIGRPRRSSHLLGENVNSHGHTKSIDNTPALDTDQQEHTINDASPTLPRTTAQRPSLYAFHRSNKSDSLRRYASFQSGFTRHIRDRSFDATSATESATRDSGEPAVAPPHALRRKPGGYLRAVTNAGELSSADLRRTKSIGSITTYSDPIRSSYMLPRESGRYMAMAQHEELDINSSLRFSLGALAEANAKRKHSLFSTESSQPPMRPSFEKEAAKLAQIPDDIDDDGGVESALLKLEGKFDESRRSRTSDLVAAHDRPLSARSLGVEALDASTREHDFELRRKRREGQPVNPDLLLAGTTSVYRPQDHSDDVPSPNPAVYQPRGFHFPIPARETHESAQSYSSLPLLQREYSYDGTREPERHDLEASPVTVENDAVNVENEQRASASSHESYDFITETDSLRKVKDAASGLDSYRASSLGDESDGESDLSSEMSLEPLSESEDNSRVAVPLATSAVTGIALPTGPLSAEALPEPSSPQLYASQLLHFSEKALPPTPGVSPSVISPAKEGHWDSEGRITPTMATVQPIQASRKTSVHLPFILGFDSQVLAQQFTLIEKDALNEIDWKELVNMRWRSISTNTRSWVDFLRTQDARGVEVVISRFNIVCKWAVSEIVLTRNLEERAQTITKYIHIAAHCRAYRNYATLYQFTVALTNTEVARLKSTWARIAPQDLVTLKSLETLVQPSRNFQNLRAEMECADASSGCIPFIGVYTHDLLFNSQRPSVITTSPTSEPLINFERCRTSAAIVKNLLRLLEASQHYRFWPIEGITERCLWMAALSDEEIRRLGDGID